MNSKPKEIIIKAITANISPVKSSLLLSRYEASQPEAMRLLKVAGVHPEHSGEFIDPYTGRPMDEKFGNIGSHCLAVAFATEAILHELLERNPAVEFSDVPAELISQAITEDAGKYLEILRVKSHPQEQGIVSIIDAHEITSDALVHDADKPTEIVAKMHMGSAAYSKDVYSNAKELLTKKLGIDSADAERIVNAGEATGHNSLASFVLLDHKGNPQLKKVDLGRMIIHLADDMTSTDFEGNTYYLTPDERMYASNFSERYPWMWKEGFGFDSSGNVVQIRDIANVDKELRHIKSYAEWQILVSTLIAEKIKLVTDPNCVLSSTSYIKALINSYWEQYKETSCMI